MHETPPVYPIGPYAPTDDFSQELKLTLIQSIREAPVALRAAVAGLTSTQLDTRYKNWTVRQITHHVGDSHLHSIIRFKWALTEDHPTIKAYEEADWVELSDAKFGELEPTLVLLEGLHQKWVQLLESMTDEQFHRAFHHPQSGATVSLWLALQNYAWHGAHHTAQILWLRQHSGW